VRHAYVVLDQDAPLFVCLTREHAEQVLRIEKDRLEQDLLESVERLHRQGLLTAQQYESDKRRAEELLSVHYLHYHIVPFAPAPRSVGASNYPERNRGDEHGT